MRYYDINDIYYNKNFGIISSEAVIYNTGSLLYKKFLNMTPLSVLENKEKKLIILDNINEIKKYYNKIFGIVKNDNVINGYLIGKIPGLQLSKLKVDFDKKIMILKELKNILEELRKYGVYYDDLNLNNIFYTNNNVKLIDIDNIKIGIYPADIKSNPNKKYFLSGGYNMECARKFLFNSMSLEFLTSKSKNCTIYQKDLDIFNENAKKLCNNLINYKIGSDADNEYLVDKILVK